MKLSRENLSLFTDLYELTMDQGYLEIDHNPKATFDLFIRYLPENRGYLVAAGLKQAVDFIRNLEFSQESLEYLKEQDFEDKFLDYLENFEFTGEVRAVPEGTPVFPNEPILEVTAPIIQAQYLETLLINQVSFQTLIATKASRMREAAGERNLVDFGSRRAHGIDAGLKAARASWIGGFEGTSNVLAGKKFGIPIFGTMAHSWIESFSSEREALKKFTRVYGGKSILLIDTYDTVQGAKIAAEVARNLNLTPKGVRLDSGDLLKLSNKVREILNEKDLEEIGIFASGGLDEYKIRDFLERGGHAEGFGVGTKLVTSKDAPALEGVYKLMACEENGELKPRMKLSRGKVTYPGQKQFFRVEKDGKYREDVLGLRDESLRGEPQLRKVIEGGNLVYNFPSLREIKKRAREEVGKLPEKYRKVENPENYPVEISDKLRETTEKLEAKLEGE